MANKAKVAGLDLKERFDDAMKSMGIWAWVVLAFAASLVFGYAIVWPVVTLAIWAVGVFFPGDLLRFGDTDYGPALNVACMLVSSMSLIVWVSFWKTAEEPRRCSAGSSSTARTWPTWLGTSRHCSSERRSWRFSS